MTRLVLVRHGESEWNAAMRVQGQGGTGLSALGRRQAELTAEAIAGTYEDAVLVSSDLQRCVETASYLARRFGADVHYDAGLRERDFGRWTGLTAAEIERADPERWTRWREGEDVVHEVGGERGEELVDRVVRTLLRLAERWAGGTIVSVTHGGSVWHGTRALLAIEGPVFGGVANCSITEIDEPATEPRLVTWNQVGHLPPELRSWLRAERVRTPAGRGKPAPTRRG